MEFDWGLCVSQNVLVLMNKQFLLEICVFIVSVQLGEIGIALLTSAIYNERGPGLEQQQSLSVSPGHAWPGEVLHNDKACIWGRSRTVDVH